MQRHQKEVQTGHTQTLPSKMPNKYHISLHVDDEEIVAQNGKAYGFNVFLLKNDNKDWVNDILTMAEHIRRIEENRNGI